MADTIGVMYLGKLVEIGPARAVYARPAHPYTRGLLDAVPVAEVGAARRPVAVRGDLPSAVNPPSGCRFRTRCPRAEALLRRGGARPVGVLRRPRRRLPLPAPDTGPGGGVAARLGPGALIRAPAQNSLQADVEGVAERVADEVEGDDGDDDEDRPTGYTCHQ